jgi:hypothetical protein
VPASRASAPASRGSQDQDLSLDERLDRLKEEDLSLDERLDRLRENALRLDRLEEIALGLGLLEKVETAPVDTGLVRQLSASWLPAPTKFESRQTSGTTVAPDSAPHSRQSSVDFDASCPGAPPGRRLSSRPMSFDMSDPDMKAPVAMPIPDTPAVICINSESDSEGECDDERAPSCERDECLRSDECDERLMGL